MIQALLLASLLVQQPSRLAAPASMGQEHGNSQPDSGPLLRFRAQRLQDGLGLTPAQADAIAQRWGQFDRELFQTQRQIGELRRRFNDILMGPESEDRKSAIIKPLLEQFMRLREQQMETKRRFEEDIRQGMSPAQQARLVLLVDDLNKKVLDILRERRQQRRGF